MPLFFLRKLTGKRRTRIANQQLGMVLTFVAGATNAGGFFAVAQYTSHMTGIVSLMADDIALGRFVMALAGLGALLSFLLGAASSTILINWGRRKHLHSVYALSLLLEALLLLFFGLMGASLTLHLSFTIPVTVMLLCYIMGLQNAIITKISRSEIRTTHVTGLVTDIGIELGKLFYWNLDHHDEKVLSNRARLKLLGTLLTMFFIGGVSGGLGFKHIGYLSTVPLAILLLLVAVVPVLDDLHFGWQKLRQDSSI